MLFRSRTKDRFLPYRDRLFAYAVALCREPDAAGDLVQDCAVRVLSARRVPKDEPAFRAWLFKIVRNLSIDRLRKTRSLGEVSIEEILDCDIMPVSAALDIVDTLAVREAFAMLPDHHRDVLALIDIGGFSYEETARILQIEKGTVMSRVSRGRSALSQLLHRHNVVEFPARQERRSG